MIAGMRVYAAVNHAASSTLLPTLLAPHNKYAIIYHRLAGRLEAGRTPHRKTSHPHILLCWSQKTTFTCLLKGTLNPLFFPAFLSVYV